MTGEQPGPARVLVVEDDPDVAELLALVLAGAGYDPVVAHEGREALEILREQRPQLILLDLMMPGMNGWEFRAAQRADPAVASIPVIVMTGGGNAAAQAEAMGASGCVTKPLDLQELLRLLAACRHSDGGTSEPASR
jgi:CheY-like chemotaxis protein